VYEVYVSYAFRTGSYIVQRTIAEADYPKAIGKIRMNEIRDARGRFLPGHPDQCAGRPLGCSRNTLAWALTVSDTGGSGPIVAMRVGRVTRQITRALVGSGGPMTTRELCGWAYPRLKELSAHHLYSVRRAAERVADRVGRRVPGGIVWALNPGPCTGLKFFRRKPLKTKELIWND
jgi:hypothetical protein